MASVAIIHAAEDALPARARAEKLRQGKLTVILEKHGDELRNAVESPVRDIVSAVRDALEETPPELASDLAQAGILLAGGGALLRGFAERLESETGVPVRIADNPLDCVALGAGQALDEMELLERTAERTGGALTALRRPGR